jgi:uncharacterized protein YhaN
MRLTRLEVESLPGVSGGFTLEPRAGVNVIVGPNTSGKSSLVRAIRGLLWPAATPGAARDLLTAEFAGANGSLTVSRRADGALIWTRDSHEVASPRLPTEHLRDRYELGLLDLVERRGAGGDRAFAAEIRRQMTGGFDLDLTGDRLFPRAPGQTTKRLNEWRQANQNCAEHERLHRDLHDRERRLDTWRDEWAEASAQGRAAEALRAALAVEDARTALAAAEERVAMFPPNLAAFRADDQPSLSVMLKRVEQAESEISAGRRRLDDTRARIEALRLSRRADTPLPAAVEALIEAWRNAEVARESAAVALAGARRQHEIAAAEMGDDNEWVGDPDRAALAKLARLFVDAEEARARKMAADALLSERLLSEGVAAGPTEPAAVAVAALERWLAAPIMSMAWPLLTAAAGLALLTVPALFRQSVGGLPGLSMVIGTLLIAAGMAGSGRTWRARRIRSARAEEARRALAAAGLTEAERALAAVDRVAAAAARDHWRREATRHELIDAWRIRLYDDRERATGRLTALESEAADLKKACGLGGELNGRGVLHDAETAARLRESVAVEARVRAELEKRAENEEERAARVHAALTMAGEPMPADAAAAGATLRDWQQRLKTLSALNDTTDQLREQLEEAARRRDSAAADLARWRARLSLAPDGTGDDQVAVLADRFPAWCEAAEARDAARAALAARLAAADPELLALPREAVAERLAGAESAPSVATELLQRITALDTELRAARAGRGLEQALAERDRTVERLVDERSTARRAALAGWLLSNLREQHAATAQPAVLETAATLLRRFTRGRHRLELLGGTGVEAEFAALDEQTGQHQSLAELSDGTRAQLLLAVRLAFITAMESGEPLPLFLDEALTTTDLDRFAAMAGALGELAREQGRQIFYLTSQPHDAGAWRQALAGRGLPEPHVIDLATVRSLAGAATAEQLAPSAPPAVPVPAPGPDGLNAWRRAVGVPPFDPRLDAKAHHVDWLLLDDAGLLHRLTVAGASYVGPLLAATTHLVDAGVLDAPMEARLRERICALEEFIAGWRRGRGRAVTPDDIDRSGVVSAAMRGPVLDLLARVEGDAKALKANLPQVPRLQDKVTERLLEHLRHSGALDELDILNENAVLTRVLGALGRRASERAQPRPDPVEVRACVGRWWAAAAVSRFRGGSDRTDPPGSQAAPTGSRG